MKAAFYTLGCKVNHYETEAMTELFRQADWEIVDFSAQADVYVVNTCTVTQISDKKSRQMLSRAHAEAPDALIVAVGCYAQSASETVEQLPGVGLVLGTDGRREIVERVEEALHGRTGSRVTDIRQTHTFEELTPHRDGRTRATLKIQDGCRNYCTYCIIPYARGPIRSRSMENIEQELHTLAQEGYREVVLTGIHLASYGLDTGNGELLDVMRLADSIDGIDRVRLGSLEPRYVDEHFCEAAAALPSLCRQFHLSLQSGSDSVLLRMNRRYTTEEYEKSVALLRQYLPDCAITTDVIAGFVGETEQEHNETLAFVEKIGFSRIHVFPYSRRKGTKADAMPGHLEKRVKDARAKELIALGERLELAFAQKQLGTIAEVLLETDGTGYTKNYVRVRAQGLEGDVVRIRLTEIGTDGILTGKELERI